MAQLTEQQQYTRMTQTPIPRLVVSMALPTVAGMLVSSIYNITDTYFVSRIGTSASAAEHQEKECMPQKTIRALN